MTQGKKKKAKISKHKTFSKDENDVTVVLMGEFALTVLATVLAEVAVLPAS